MYIYIVVGFSKAGSVVLYKHVPAFAYSPRCAPGYSAAIGFKVGSFFRSFKWPGAGGTS